ncbi:peptidoglycan D,D-transpeptidase FtsI family protein [Corynebacterium terpenotabidum]|uniref:Penicillin-binding protein n=1 Tax=Corynebacterium terpenotabidum Y-11 TaxID=1200352 RepID=S4XJ07_9CORY|nr:penicillin-binding protein 2 [Corynebacterium terpenotabidum]AGP30578.1 penicillin-binding protein [Corynebacterium terpenotabidum Y-11]
MKAGASRQDQRWETETVDQDRNDRRGQRRSVPGNSWRTLDTSAAGFHSRGTVVVVAVVVIVVVLIARLMQIQLVKGDSLSASAAEQRTSQVNLLASRGQILDRDGRELAYTMKASMIVAHPASLPTYMADRYRLDPRTEDNPDGALPPDEQLEEIITELPAMLDGDTEAVKEDDLREALTSEDTYRRLVTNVDPDIAEKITQRWPELVAEPQDIRQYPNGAVGANIIGKYGWVADGVEGGQYGLELSADAGLQGKDGSYTADFSNGVIIPGTVRDQHPAVDGNTYELTIDTDAQTFVQQQVQQAKEKSGAESASAVVLDAKTGEVIAMATSDTINPMGDLQQQVDQGKEFTNRAVESAFEPGSVAKVMTAAAAIEEGKTTPDEVLQVPGSIDLAGVTVKDAWDHGVVSYTTTGVFGKSSNVGTLMLAQRVGEEKFSEYLDRFGIGQATNLGLPAETAGYVPDLAQWSGGTFANLPIGQGMSMSLLQMTSIYQALANDGVRITPSLIRSETTADGTEIPQAEPEKTTVVSPATARTVVDMFRAINQDDPTGVQEGTAPGAGIEGYQTSGKTGTAQQIDPETKAYSNSNYWITYAGIAPADDPRFVVGIMLDNPQRSSDGSGGQSAAPLFHDIGSWLLDHYNVPLSATEAPRLILEAQ